MPRRRWSARSARLPPSSSCFVGVAVPADRELQSPRAEAGRFLHLHPSRPCVECGDDLRVAVGDSTCALRVGALQRVRCVAKTRQGDRHIATVPLRGSTESALLGIAAWRSTAYSASHVESNRHLLRRP